MKIDFKKKPKRERWSWDLWFAWYPVVTRTRNGKWSIIWLEEVERQWLGGMDGYQYEAKARKE